jgi:FKBP-type peptidyl-prolyl cis-trans isomerase
MQEIRDTEEALVNVNRMLVQKDRVKILEYINKHDLTMKELESGLWYQIIQEGQGRKVDDQTVVTLTYNLSLLNGTSLYSSDSLGPKQFRVGKGGVESGLEEGILLLKEGSSAIFILPPHLAHGLTGDGNKIPARSVIVYKVELNKVDPV